MEVGEFEVEQLAPLLILASGLGTDLLLIPLGGKRIKLGKVWFDG